MYHELTVWSCGLISEEHKHRHFHPPVQRPVTGYLAMQNGLGHLLPGHIATIQRTANRSWEASGMDVPLEPRAGEDPQRHRKLRDETYSMPLNRGFRALGLET